MQKKTRSKKEPSLSELLLVVNDLTEYYDLINFMDEYQEVRAAVDGIQVKGKGRSSALLPTLKKYHDIIDNFDSEGEFFPSIHDDFNECIEYLDGNYSIKSRWLKEPEHLRQEDFEKISNYLDNIVRSLIGYSDKLMDTSTNITGLAKISKRLVKDMDKKTKDDLKEAIDSLEFGLTTGSFMLFCRVAEKMAKSYYEKFTKNSSKDKTWNNMFKEIKNKQEEGKNVQRSVLALFDFLREKRNLAQHPGVRFGEEDCEKIFHYIDDFYLEISKP